MYRMKINAKKDSEYRHHIQLKYPGACSQLDLEAVLLFATFPYGMGGPNQKRPCNISKKRIIKRYAQLVMPQFMMIHDNNCNPSTMHHIFSWKTSFDTGTMNIKNELEILREELKVMHHSRQLNITPE